MGTVPLFLPGLAGRSSGLLLGGHRLDRHRVDFATHELAQGLVDELVAGDRTLAGELRADDARGEMDVVVRAHFDTGAGQSPADEGGDLVGSHGESVRNLHSGFRRYDPGMNAVV